MPMVSSLAENTPTPYLILESSWLNFLTIAFNVLAEHLFSQVDSEGNQYRLFKEIINHRKGKLVVDKADQFRLDRRTGNQVMKQTTAGW
jgi:hypothetical protein